VSLVLYRYSSAIPLPSTSIQRMSQTHVFFFPSFLTSSRNKQDHCHEGMNCHHNEPQLVRCDKVHHHLVARRMARQSTSTSAPAARSMRGPFAEQQRSMASMTDLDMQNIHCYYARHALSSITGPAAICSTRM
jgi:hypothetical protein